MRCAQNRHRAFLKKFLFCFEVWGAEPSPGTHGKMHARSTMLHGTCLGGGALPRDTWYDACAFYRVTWAWTLRSQGLLSLLSTTMAMTMIPPWTCCARSSLYPPSIHVHVCTYIYIYIHIYLYV